MRAAVQVPVGRLALASLLVAYLALAPCAVQVFGVESEALVRWTMFNTEVNQMCLVDYREVRPGAGQAGARVDRYEWLGVWDPGLAPPDVALIRSPEAALALGQRLCRERPGVELRAIVRCPRDGAWERVPEPALQGETNLCEVARR